MARIYQFNHTDGRNQIYVDDLQRISDATTNIMGSLPWTKPVAISNAKLSGSGLEITPDTFVVINGVVFGCDTTATVSASQYLYAICEYDTTQPRNKADGGNYQQAVVRYLKVSDSRLSDTDYNNVKTFPGLGEYIIAGIGQEGDPDNEIPFREDGTTIPFDISLVIPSGGITSDFIGPLAVTTEDIANGAVTSPKIGTGAIITDKIADGAVTTQKIAAHAVTRQELDNDLDLQTKFAAGLVNNGESLTAPMIGFLGANSALASYELYVANSNLMSDYMLPITLLVWNPELSSKTLSIKRNNSSGLSILSDTIAASSRYRYDIWVSQGEYAYSVQKVDDNGISL